MTDQSTWPAHLRDDAPSQQCSRCGRHTWDVEEFGAECRMTQPNGGPCGGRFRAEPELKTPDEWAAKIGVRIVDPDGWRGVNGRDWADPISRDEFHRRMAISTVIGLVSTDEAAT